MISHPRTLLAILALAAGLGACDSPSGLDDSPLTREEVRRVTPPSMDVFADAYARVRQENPQVAEESNAFGRLLLREIQSLSTQSLQPSAGRGPIAANLLDRLNDAEWDLLMRDGNWRFGLATRDAANKAGARAISDFGVDQEDSKADAFRHTYWNVLMARCCGVPWAREFATAHESTTGPGDPRTMDLSNNEAGRNIFVLNPGLDEEGYAAKIKEYPLTCVDEGVTHDTGRIVYIEQCPTVEVFDDGPDFDDVYEVTLADKVLGTTPKGSGDTFTTSGVLSGRRALTVRCTVDGTRGGCGFKVRLGEGIRLVDGRTVTEQLVLREGGSLSLTVSFPTLGGHPQQQAGVRSVSGGGAGVPGRRL